MPYAPSGNNRSKPTNDAILISRNVTRETFAGKVTMVLTLQTFNPLPLFHPINICLSRYHTTREFS
jgi:hypothetical protein